MMVASLLRSCEQVLDGCLHLSQHFTMLWLPLWMRLNGRADHPCRLYRSRDSIDLSAMLHPNDALMHKKAIIGDSWQNMRWHTFNKFLTTAFRLRDKLYAVNTLSEHISSVICYVWPLNTTIYALVSHYSEGKRHITTKMQHLTTMLTSVKWTLGSSGLRAEYSPRDSSH